VITRNIAEAACFCPPLIITAAQINDMFEAMGRALDKVAKRRV
jgi:4-aminobutyrate--pyruvate transaminase